MIPITIPNVITKEKLLFFLFMYKNDVYLFKKDELLYFKMYIIEFCVRSLTFARCLLTSSITITTLHFIALSISVMKCNIVECITVDI